MAKHHLIITGTGRAGTTFLVKLLTVLGLDTGFTDLSVHVSPTARAGMEWDLFNPKAPYIIKSPWFCDHLDDLLNAADIIIDHALVPMRDLYAAAESRRFVTRSTPHEGAPDNITGGLWHTEDPQTQETVLAHQLYKLLYTLAKRDIPLTLLEFPRLAQDSAYLYRKLEGTLPAISFDRFDQAFQEVVRPELIHDFRTISEEDGTLFRSRSGEKVNRTAAEIMRDIMPPVVLRAARRLRDRYKLPAV